MAGPVAKSKAQKRAEGNPDKRSTAPKTSLSEPKSSFDVPPEELHKNPDAEAEWRRVVPVLRRRRSISTVDRSMLIAYCLTYAMWVRASKAVMTRGSYFKTKNGYQALTPDAQTERDQKAAMVKLTDKLGLNPLSRSHITVDPTLPVQDPNEAPEDEDDERFRRLYEVPRRPVPAAKAG